MSRLPPKPRDQLSAEEQEVHDKFYGISEYAYGKNNDKFIWKDSNDALVGPFPFFIAAPAMGNAIYDLALGFAQLPLPADAREVAILTVGGHFQAGYELYGHVPQGIEAGLSREQAAVLQKGEGKPDGLNEQCDTAYDVAHYLLTRKGRLLQPLWDRSVEAFGKDGTVALLHYVGFYCYACVALNGMDAPVPE